VFNNGRDLNQRGLSTTRVTSTWGVVIYCLLAFMPQKLLEFILTSFPKGKGPLSLQQIRKYLVEQGILKADEINISKVISKNRLNIISYHSVKGLENKCIILLGTDKLPFSKSKTKSKTAKERRRDRKLFYVALTRAQEKLILIGEREEGFFKEFAEFLQLKQIQKKGLTERLSLLLDKSSTIW
jgi:superfamily I DNA/RNA helicase